MPPRVSSASEIPGIPLLAKGGDKVGEISYEFGIASPGLSTVWIWFRHHAQESLYSPLDRRSEAYRHAVAATLAAKGKAQVPEKIMNIPNIMTFIRLALVPVLLGLWEWQWKYSPLTCAVIFIVAALTDWLDGYLARKVSGIS